MTPGRILVVDDEPQIRRVMRATLAAQGYEVHDARTGEDALNAIRTNRFDLVLLDMNMPGMGGLETCRAIRASSEVAIIILSVRNSEKDKVAALDAGADDYVTKPFSTPELLARIRAALRRQPATSEPAGEISAWATWKSISPPAASSAKTARSASRPRNSICCNISCQSERRHSARTPAASRVGAGLWR